MSNYIKGIVIAPFALVWLYVIGHIIIGFYIPLFWYALRGIFGG